MAVTAADVQKAWWLTTYNMKLLLSVLAKAEDPMPKQELCEKCGWDEWQLYANLGWLTRRFGYGLVEWSNGGYVIPDHLRGVVCQKLGIKKEKKTMGEQDEATKYNVSAIEVFRVDTAKDVSVGCSLYVLHLTDDELAGTDFKLVDESVLANWLDSRRIRSELAALIRQAADTGYTAKYETESGSLQLNLTEKQSLPFTFTFEYLDPLGFLLDVPSP